MTTNLWTKSLTSLLTIAFISFPIISYADDTTVGELNYATGDIVAQQANGNLRTLTLHSPLFSHDLINNGNEAITQFRFLDGTLLGLRLNSILRVEDYGENNYVLNLLDGGLRINTDPNNTVVSNPGKLAINTLAAKITAEGGQQGIDLSAAYDTEHHLFVGVDRGKATITNAAGTVLIGDNQANRFAYIASANAAPEALPNAPAPLQSNISLITNTNPTANLPINIATGSAPAGSTESTTSTTSTTNTTSNTATSQATPTGSYNSPAISNNAGNVNVTDQNYSSPGTSNNAWSLSSIYNASTYNYAAPYGYGSDQAYYSNNNDYDSLAWWWGLGLLSSYLSYPYYCGYYNNWWNGGWCNNWWYPYGSFYSFNRPFFFHHHFFHERFHERFHEHEKGMLGRHDRNLGQGLRGAAATHQTHALKNTALTNRTSRGERLANRNAKNFRDANRRMAYQHRLQGAREARQERYNRTLRARERLAREHFARQDRAYRMNRAYVNRNMYRGNMYRARYARGPIYGRGVYHYHPAMYRPMHAVYRPVYRPAFGGIGGLRGFSGIRSFGGFGGLGHIGGFGGFGRIGGFGGFGGGHMGGFGGGHFGGGGHGGHR